MNTEENNTQLPQSSVSGLAIIAQFMGWQKSIYENLPDKVYKENYTIGTHLDKLNYHQDWNLLMPVIEEISKLKFEDNDSYYPRTFGIISEEGQFMFRFNNHQLFKADTLIECAYNAVVDCLQNLPVADR